MNTSSLIKLVKTYARVRGIADTTASREAFKSGHALGRLIDRSSTITLARAEAAVETLSQRWPEGEGDKWPEGIVRPTPETAE